MSLWVFLVPIIILLVFVILCKRYNWKFFRKIHDDDPYNLDSDSSDYDSDDDSDDDDY